MARDGSATVAEAAAKNLKGAAETSFKASDLPGAKRRATEAARADPSLAHEASCMLAAYDLHLAALASKRCGGAVDWYAVPNADALSTNDTIRCSYRKLCQVVQPHTNRSAAAEGGFKLVSEA